MASVGFIGAPFVAALRARRDRRGGQGAPRVAPRLGRHDHRPTAWLS